MQFDASKKVKENGNVKKKCRGVDRVSFEIIVFNIDATNTLFNTVHIHAIYANGIATQH